MLDEHDHRVLGRRMRLFHFQEEGPGMAFWHPRGLACLRLLEEQVRREMEADGFQEVRTPQILARSLWERSGHWTAYREGLLVMPGPPERAGDDEVWDHAEAMLAAAASQAGLAFELHPGEGAFYGPKLEFTLQDHRGRAWQCGTIQLDMVLPERFDLQVPGAGGEARRPVMLHRAMLGSLERFLGILLEHHQGRLPSWLAPEQILLAPVEARHESFAVQVADRFRQAGLRARVAPAAHGLGRRVKEARELGIPWFLALGDQEEAGGPFRFRPLRGPAVQRSQAEALDWLAEDGGA